MNFNTATFAAVVETAKQKAANHPEWMRAIQKAAGMLQSGELHVTLLVDGALVTSPRGSYLVNGNCPCAARTAHCYHRAGKRLVEMMEAPSSENILSVCDDIAASPRKNLIIEIENVWPKSWPPLATELMARFGKNQLQMLDDDMLRRVRLAIAI